MSAIDSLDNLSIELDASGRPVLHGSFILDLSTVPFHHIQAGGVNLDCADKKNRFCSPQPINRRKCVVNMGCDDDGDDKPKDEPKDPKTDPPTTEPSKGRM